MTALTCFSGRLALIAAAAIACAVIQAPRPAAAAPDACAQALAYEKTAAADSVSRQAAYDSAVAGLAANQRCPDAQEKLVNEAFLLSMRAPAEHELKIGNWQQDFTRANMLLLQCTNWPGLRGTKAAGDCATQRQYNLMMAKTITTIPSPRPTAPPTPPAPGPARSGMPAPASPMSPGPSSMPSPLPSPRTGR